MGQISTVDSSCILRHLCKCPDKKFKNWFLLAPFARAQQFSLSLECQKRSGVKPFVSYCTGGKWTLYIMCIIAVFLTIKALSFSSVSHFILFLLSSLRRDSWLAWLKYRRASKLFSRSKPGKPYLLVHPNIFICRFLDCSSCAVSALN